jgi:hypothetical protein
MRLIKRLLLFACELGVLGFGFLFSSILAAGVTIGVNPSQSTLAAIVFFAGYAVGLILSGFGFAGLRRVTRAWEIESDAADWERSRAERKLHPARARCKRMAVRIGVWVPSAIAAGVLFFLPVATHAVHPGSHYLRHYRVPIPWNTFVLSSSSRPFGYGYAAAFASSGGMARFGVRPFWDSEPLSSEMVFQSFEPEDRLPDISHWYAAPRGAGAVQEVRREFQLGGVGLTCWQHVDRRYYGAWVRPFGTEPPQWYIRCGTPVGARERNLYAWFAGRKEDMPVFYKVIEGVKLVE